MKKLIIAGGSGFLGEVLQEHFKNDFDKIVVLTRSEEKKNGNISFIQWDGESPGSWENELDGAEVLINLTGKSVDCRYHQKNKDLILSSRINATKVLGEAVSKAENPPKIWINSSTATIYRHSMDKEMDEQSGELGAGFSVDVATRWEETFFETSTPQTRKVAIRTSIVLGKHGGALKPMRFLTRVGFGGKQGPGDQKVSWIHEKDFARSIDHIITYDQIEGVINIVSPTPTTNDLLMKTLRKHVGVPFGLNMGRNMLELGARIIKTETELILKSRNVIPGKLLDTGFKFQFGSLDAAIANLLIC